MERDEILDKVGVICMDVLEVEGLNITESTSAADVEGWDSLAHIGIMSEIETAFNIEFSLDDMQNAKSIGQLVNIVSKHLAKN